MAWSDAEIKAGRYDAFRKRMMADNLAGIDGLLVGVVGLGVIGLAVAQAFHRAGARLCYFDPFARCPHRGRSQQAAPWKNCCAPPTSSRCTCRCCPRRGT
ncbi:MAG: hypothetical protein KIT18_00095 [Burkholderiales bacterium]|nr:hypothetical protein [Burkholderiales bacterium]